MSKKVKSNKSKHKKVRKVKAAPGHRVNWSDLLVVNKPKDRKHHVEKVEHAIAYLVTAELDMKKIKYSADAQKEAVEVTVFSSKSHDELLKLLSAYREKIETPIQG